MKGIDLVDTLYGAMASMPLRVLAIIFACSAGLTLPLLIQCAYLENSHGMLEGIGWAIAIFPVYIGTVAIISGWWAIVAIPLLLVLAVRSLLFLRNDLPPSELLVIATITYFCTITAASPHWVTAIVVGSLLAYLSYRWKKNDINFDPF